LRAVLSCLGRGETSPEISVLAVVIGERGCERGGSVRLLGEGHTRRCRDEVVFQRLIGELRTTPDWRHTRPSRDGHPEILEPPFYL